MSKHEGFRFWENLEKKSGSQELPNRLLSPVYCSVFTCTILRHLNSAPEIVKRNKPSSQVPEEEGQRKKEEGAASLSKSNGVRPADLARLEKVVSKLELEQGACPRGIAGSNQVLVVVITFLKSAKNSIPKGCSEDELLQRLALATTRIERVVGIPGR